MGHLRFRNGLRIFPLCLILCGVALIGFAPTGWGAPEDGFTPGAKRPLDLPAGGKAPDSEEEEDAPETILFYGGEFEGDCFVFVFPAYGFCGETTVFNAIRAEISESMMQLSETSTFSLVGFNSQTYVWSPTVQTATPGRKGEAVAWMSTLVPIEAHCVTEAATTALGISQAAESTHKQMMLCGARAPYCNGQGGGDYVNNALLTITGANYEQTPIHTVYFSSSFYGGEQFFYQQLATLNGGTFREVAY